jgi:hypothetical protein
MKRPLYLDLAALAILIAAGAVTRLAFQDLPNFAPVAALAMFAGYFFRDWRLAACVPVGAMLISDAVIGSDHWAMRLTVYGSLCLPILWRDVLRRWLKLDGPTPAEAAGSAAILLGGSVLGSLLFFVITNTAVWVIGHAEPSPMYSRDLGGLLNCLAQGVPFFRYTLLGDLSFGVIFFGAYAAALNTGLVSEQFEEAKAT